MLMCVKKASISIQIRFIVLLAIIGFIISGALFYYSKTQNEQKEKAKEHALAVQDIVDQINGLGA